jgi:hypothetical protein
MNVNSLLYWPYNMSESLDWLELSPFRGLCVVHFERYYFPHCVCSTSNDKHKWPKEKSRVLIPRSWRGRGGLIRCLHPVPSSIPVSSEAPSVLKRGGIICSTSKHHHHTIGWSVHTKCGRMIYSHTRNILTAIELLPWERSFLNTQTPYIIYRFTSSVTTKDE